MSTYEARSFTIAFAVSILMIKGTKITTKLEATRGVITFYTLIIEKPHKMSN